MLLGHYIMSLKTGVLTSGVCGEAPVFKFAYRLAILLFFAMEMEAGLDPENMLFTFIVSGL